MTCDDFREMAGSYLDGEQTAEDESVLFHHLAGCADCRAYAGVIVRMKEKGRNTQIVYPEELDQRIMGQTIGVHRTETAGPAGIRPGLTGRFRNRQIRLSFWSASVIVVATVILGILIGEAIGLRFPRRSVPVSSKTAGDVLPRVVITYLLPAVEVHDAPLGRNIETSH
jgi:anti-sigma factor RsiW